MSCYPGDLSPRTTDRVILRLGRAWEISVLGVRPWTEALKGRCPLARGPASVSLLRADQRHPRGESQQWAVARFTPRVTLALEPEGAGVHVERRQRSRAKGGGGGQAPTLGAVPGRKRAGGEERVEAGCPWAQGLLGPRSSALGLAPLGCEVGGRRGHSRAGWPLRVPVLWAGLRSEAAGWVSERCVPFALCSVCWASRLTRLQPPGQALPRGASTATGV